MGLLSKIFSNTRKPEGFFGKMMVNGMNGGGHAQMANWALSSVQIKEDGQILDIGCGVAPTSPGCCNAPRKVWCRASTIRLCRWQRLPK